MGVREIVKRARSLIGCRFRPQGRDPTLGLDCVGLVTHVFAIPTDLVRRDYRLRGRHRQELESELARFLSPVANARPGDVLLCEVAARQMHLAIHCGGSFIHADAGLRLIVETPGKPRWPVVAAFRHPILSQD